MTEQKEPYVNEFPLREAHHLVRDLMTPNPWIYWIDFTFHIILGWAAFFTALFSPLFSLWQLGGFVVAVLALYRSAIFVHELAHLKEMNHSPKFWAWVKKLCPEYEVAKRDLTAISAELHLI